jgi:hypothetical protein
MFLSFSSQDLEHSTVAPIYCCRAASSAGAASATLFPTISAAPQDQGAELSGGVIDPSTLRNELIPRLKLA